MADKIKWLDVIERGNLVCRAFKMTNKAVGEGVDLGPQAYGAGNGANDSGGEIGCIV